MKLLSKVFSLLSFTSHFSLSISLELWFHIQISTDLLLPNPSRFMPLNVHVTEFNPNAGDGISSTYVGSAQ
jgi:hypothetical protein